MSRRPTAYGEASDGDNSNLGHVTKFRTAACKDARLGSPHHTMIDALKAIATPKSAADFTEARKTIRANGGAAAFLAHLKETGFVGDDDKLTTGVKPFNVFARVASGVMKQPGMEGENAALGQFAERFVVASNRPENDENWASEDPEWVGKSSMGERHRFLTIKDLSWQYFNVLSFGLAGDVSSLKAAIEVLEAMQAAASAFASATTGWSAEPNRLGLYFHCFPHNSVNSLHLHMVDLAAVGPSFKYHSHKNLPLSAVLAVLKTERLHAELNARLAAVTDVMNDARLAVEEMDAKANTPIRAMRKAVLDDMLHGILDSEALKGKPAEYARFLKLSVTGGPLAHEASWYADDESFSAAIQELLTLKSTVLGWSAEALAKGLAEFEKEGVVEVQ